MHYKKFWDSFVHFVIIIIIIIIIISVPSGYSTKQNTVQYKTRCAINAADSPSSGGLQVKIINKEEHTYITNNNFILFDINQKKTQLKIYNKVHFIRH